MAAGPTSESPGVGASPRVRRLALRGEQETLVIPLYARALDYRSRTSILQDARASEIVASIDYDFERLRTRGSGRLLVVRARQFDEWAREYLRSQPSAVVLNLGCGLDSRVERVRPPSEALWADVDLPEVIELRRVFFSERDGYRMLAGSIIDAAWLDGLPHDRPVLAVADGVLEYLPPDDVRELFRRLVTTFPRGEIVFDVMSSKAIRMGNERLRARSGALLRWSVDDLRSVDAFHPKLKRTADLAVFGSRYLPQRYRLLFGIGYLVPSFRRTIRLVRCEF